MYSQLFLWFLAVQQRSIICWVMTFSKWKSRAWANLLPNLFFFHASVRHYLNEAQKFKMNLLHMKNLSSSIGCALFSLPDVNYHHVNKEIEREKHPAALLKSLLESFAEDRISSRKHLGNHSCLVSFHRTALWLMCTDTVRDRLPVSGYVNM